MRFSCRLCTSSACVSSLSLPHLQIGKPLIIRVSRRVHVPVPLLVSVHDFNDLHKPAAFRDRPHPLCRLDFKRRKETVGDLVQERLRFVAVAPHIDAVHFKGDSLELHVEPDLRDGGRRGRTKQTGFSYRARSSLFAEGRNVGRRASSYSVGVCVLLWSLLLVLSSLTFWQ